MKMKMKMKTIGLMGLLLLAAAVVGGCAEANQAAYEVGQPVGAAAAVPHSLTQGATDGYVGNSNQNPYGR